jgi:hypothetical protein
MTFQLKFENKIVDPLAMWIKKRDPQDFWQISEQHPIPGFSTVCIGAQFYN